jgi:Domain of Unknown Function (DUF1080)
MLRRASSVLVAAAAAVACSQQEPPERPAAGAEASAVTPQSDQEAGGVWTTLFDGTTFAGWNRVGEANWTLADGAAEANDGSGGFLVTAVPYADFDLEVEFWVSPDANSGVFIRCQNPQEIGAMNCYEVNVYDQRPDPTYRTGAIVDVAAPAEQIDAGGSWNTFEISARGPRLTVKLNGTTTVDAEDGRFTSGHIALQRGAGVVRFRSVKVRAP